MHWHIEADVICLIIMAAMFVDLRKRDFSTMQQDSVFKGLTKLTIMCIAIDIAASLAMDYATSWWLYQVLNVIYFATLPILPMAWFHYICTVIYSAFSKKARAMMGICLMPGDLFALICLTNPFTGWIFVLDKNMTYERGPLFEVAYYMLIFYTIISFVAVIVKRKRIAPRSRIALFLSFFVAVGLAVFIQISFSGMLLINAAYTVMFVITHFYIQNRTTFTDGLTGLYSRATGEQRVNDFILKHDETTMAFIITDLDHFKTINDTYGHKQGDAVLKAAASACMEAFPNNSVLSRLGGDEFLILCIDYGNTEELNKMLASVGKIMHEKLLKTVPECAEKATISMGVALFPEHGSNFMELYENADIALYQGKWFGRNRFVIFSKEKTYYRREAGDVVAEDVRRMQSGASFVDDIMPVNKEKIMLIIDDSEMNRNILEQIFKEDFFILQAEDSTAALRLLRRHGISIDIILLDLMMPGKDGYDFMEEKECYLPCKNIPVVVVTGSESERDYERALECGAIDIIKKPVDQENAKQTIEDVLVHYGEGFSYNDRYQRELLNLANSGLHGGMICVYNEPGHPLEYISLSFVEFLGYENHQELYEKNDGKWDNIIYEEDLLSILETVSKELSHGGEYTKLEYRLKRKNGEIVWVHDSGKILRMNAGREVIVALCMDVTDSVRLKTEPKQPQDPPQAPKNQTLNSQEL